MLLRRTNDYQPKTRGIAAPSDGAALTMWRRLVPRLTVTLLGVLVLYGVILTAPTLGWRRFVSEGTFREVMLAAMRAGERARCEGDPAGWSYRSPAGGTYFAYDPQGHAASSEAPPIPARLSERLAAGDKAAMDLTLLEPGAGGRSAVARMPWDGPCAMLHGRIPLEQAAVARTALFGALSWALVCALLALGAALLVYAPMVRRIRKLRSGAEAIASGNYAERLALEGRDEVAEIGAAFNAAAEEVERRDRAMTQLLQNVSHDLVTPLAALQAAVERLSRIADRRSPEAEEQLSQALEEVTYIASLVDDLKAISRTEAGLGEPQPVELDLREVVERTTARFTPLARRREISLDFSVPDDAVRIEADPTQALQALANVVQNAIQYNNPGGHVAIILDKSDGGPAGIRVRDDGPGVPEELWPRLTERLFRGDEARRRRPGGTGLGLAIAAQVAEAHGWGLSFAAVEPQGLEVRLSLQAKD